MVFIDTHTHCTDEAFPGAEQDLFVERALAAGVSKMLLADIDTGERDGALPRLRKKELEG